MNKAETDFREAFERLKAGTSRVLPWGSPVTQNNIAKEAGRDPSALKKSRYPTLIDEIQKWKSGGDVNLVSSSNCLKEKSAKALEEALFQVSELRVERDLLISKLLVANERILLLTSKIRANEMVSEEYSPLVRGGI